MYLNSVVVPNYYYHEYQVMVDGCRCKLLNVVSGVPQGGVLGPLLFLLYSSELFPTLGNKPIGYADDSTFMAFVPSPGVRVAVAESLIRDCLAMIKLWVTILEGCLLVIVSSPFILIYFCLATI